MDYQSTMTGQDGVNIHFKNGYNVYDKDTAFGVIDEFGREKILKNVILQVGFYWSDGYFADKFKFRNPPLFYNAIPELR